MKQEKELINPEHLESRYPEIVDKIAACPRLLSDVLNGESERVVSVLRTANDEELAELMQIKNEQEKVTQEKDPGFACKQEESLLEERFQECLQKISARVAQELSDMWEFVRGNLLSLSDVEKEQIEANNVKIGILHSQYPGIVQKTFGYPQLLCRLCDLLSLEPNDAYKAILKDSEGVLVKLLAENSDSVGNFICTIAGHRAIELVGKILGVSDAEPDDVSQTLSENAEAQPEGVALSGIGCNEFTGCVVN